MKKLLTLCLLLSWLPARGATQYGFSIGITNTPGVGAYLLINGTDQRTWTNAAQAAAWITATNTVPWSVSNLYNQLAVYAPGSYVAPSLIGTNVWLIGPAGTNFTLTASAGWCRIDSTNWQVNYAHPFFIPWTACPTNTRTNMASELVEWLNNVNTTSTVKVASSAFSNLVDASSAQTIRGAKLFTNATLTDPVLQRATLGFTNFLGQWDDVDWEQDVLWIHGNSAIWMDSNSFILTANAATNVTPYVDALRLYGFTFDLLHPTNNTVVRRGDVPGLIPAPAQYAPFQFAATTNSVALTNGVRTTNAAFWGIPYMRGNLSWAAGSNLVEDSASDFWNFNTGAAANTNTTARLRDLTNGVAAYVSTNWIPQSRGSNNLWGGTNTVKGSLAYSPGFITTLANGNNRLVVGTNAYLRASGMTTTGGIISMAKDASGTPPEDGFICVIRIQGQTSLTIANESGSEATASLRITTGTGGTLTSTNNPAYLHTIYNGTAQRWEVISLTP